MYVQEFFMSENKPKKFRFNPRKVVAVLITVLCILLVVGIGTWYHLENTDQVIKAPKSASTAASATATPLPSNLTDPNSYQYIVNKNIGVLSSSFVPGDLTDPENVTSTSGVITLRAEAAGKLTEMVKAAADAGVNLYVTSAYRSYDEQEQLYTSYSSLLKQSELIVSCAQAGYSEHQLGLAVDFTDDTSVSSQTEAFADTAAGQWLYQHAHEYGFILRYPKDKQNVTGFSYKPWHYRYVGTDTANAMYAVSPDETMEEYFNLK
jgi:D-alanyl-D-alanine carboxypeptidase